MPQNWLTVSQPGMAWNPGRLRWRTGSRSTCTATKLRCFAVPVCNQISLNKENKNVCISRTNAQPLISKICHTLQCNSILVPASSLLHCRELTSVPRDDSVASRKKFWDLFEALLPSANLSYYWTELKYDKTITCTHKTNEIHLGTMVWLTSGLF